MRVSQEVMATGPTRSPVIVKGKGKKSGPKSTWEIQRAAWEQPENNHNDSKVQEKERCPGLSLSRAAGP